MNRDLVQSAGSTATRIHNGDPLFRAELESRILAGQPQCGIALLTRLPFEVVHEYEAQLFNERPRFSGDHQPCLILNGWRSNEVLDSRNVARLWRIVAIDYGILILEPLLTCVDREKLKKQGLLAYLGQKVKLVPSLKLLVAQACCPRLRTPHGQALARNLATQSDWQVRLPAGEKRSGAFAKIVSLLRKDVLAENVAG